MESASAKPTTVRVWFDPMSRLWCAQRWDAIGGTCRAPRIYCGSPSFSSGPNDARLVFVHSQLKVGGIRVADPSDAVVDFLTVDNKRGDLKRYAVWFDELASCWNCRPLDTPGGVVRSARLQSTDRCESDGRFLRFFHAEIKIGTDRWLQTGDVMADELRIMPRSQFVHCPVVAKARGAARAG